MLTFEWRCFQRFAPTYLIGWGLNLSEELQGNFRHVRNAMFLTDRSWKLQVKYQTKGVALFNFKLVKHPRWQSQCVIVFILVGTILGGGLIGMSKVFHILARVLNFMDVCYDLAIVVFNRALWMLAILFLLTTGDMVSVQNVHIYIEKGPCIWNRDE